MSTPFTQVSEAEKRAALQAGAAARIDESKALPLSRALSEKAVEQLRAYAMFYLWAIPLFELGHVIIGKKSIEFSQVIAKRFLVGLGTDGLPRIEVQASEMRWMSRLPWAAAGIHFKSGRILLFCRPEPPLSATYFVIPVDLPEKLEPFKGKNFINISEFHFFDTPYKGTKITLELIDIQDHFFTKQKVKLKL